MKTHALDLFGFKIETTRGQEPAGNWLQIGRVSGGEININENVRRVEAVSGVYFYHSIVEATVSAEFAVVDAHLQTLVNLIKNDISLSVVAGSPTDYIVKALGCLVDEVSLEGRVGEPLRATVSLRAMKPSLVATAPTIQPLSGNLVLWHDAAVTVAGNNYQVSRFQLRVRRNPHVTADFSAKANNEKRLPNLAAYGVAECEFNCEIFLPFTPHFAADAPAPVSVAISLPDDKTLNLSNFVIATRRVPISGGSDLWIMTLTLQGSAANISLD
jgi:hypothetical protein